MNHLPYIRDLTDLELRALDHAARERHGPKRGAGVRNHRVDTSRDDLDIDLAGIAAEWVCSQLYAWDFDHRRALLGGTGKIDGRKNGWTVMVNATFSAGGRFILRADADFVADYGVLCENRGRAVAVMGYMTREDFLAHAQSRNLGHGLNRCLDQRWLRPPLDLQDLLDVPPRVPADVLAKPYELVEMQVATQERLI